MNSLLLALRNRCPECGTAPLFKGLFTLHELCPRCCVRHERWEGSWTIASWLSASLGVTVGGGLALLLAVSPHGQELFSNGLELFIIGVGTLVAVASYRPFKALTFGALHAVGMVHADPVQVGNVIYLKRYKERRAGEHDGPSDAPKADSA